MDDQLQRQNGMVAGVCGGIAARYGWDPAIIRLIFVLLLLPGGFPGPTIYAIFWLIMPKKKGS